MGDFYWALGPREGVPELWRSGSESWTQNAKVPFGRAPLARGPPVEVLDNLLAAAKLVVQLALTNNLEEPYRCP